MEVNRPVAYLRYTAPHWIARDRAGRVICKDLHRSVVVGVCVELGYRVTEEREG